MKKAGRKSLRDVETYGLLVKRKKENNKEKLKSERGSITVFVLSTMLIVLGVIFVAYFSMMNKSSSQAKQLEKIQEEYNVSSDMMSQEYEESMENSNPSLVMKWVSKIDGNGEEEFLDVVKTSDGGYIAVGYTTSTDISGLTNNGGEDAIIVKYDEYGNEQWKKSVGGSKDDRYSGVIELTDGIYIAVGTIYSTDVLDENGNNIGHGYDWSINEGNIVGSIDASEGIIGKYDSMGNEISLTVTGLATDDFYEDEYADFDIGTSAANIEISGIDKVSDGGYILTGSRIVGIPSTFLGGKAIDNCQLAIKYNANGEEIAQLINGKNSYGEESTSTIFNGLKGVIETNDNDYILFGEIDNDIHYDINILKTNSNLENVETLGDGATRGVKNLFLDSQDNFIVLEISLDDNSFYRIYKQNDWENTDIALKSISKSSSTEFVGISEDNRFLKYNIEDGSILEEYNVPTYESVYAIEGEEEFILLGSPTDEEGITIEGTSGAVIAKYAIE